MEKVPWVCPSCWAVGGSLPGRRKGCEWVSEASFMKCPSRNFSTRVFSLQILNVNRAQVHLFLQQLPLSTRQLWNIAVRHEESGKPGSEDIHLFQAEQRCVLKKSMVLWDWNRRLMVFTTEVLQDTKMKRKFTCCLFALDNTYCLLL